MQPKPQDMVWKTDQASAQRFASAIALHQVALTKDEILKGRFIAVQLADGGHDGTAYESYATAVVHNRNNPSRICPFQIPLERISPRECDRLLWYMRSAHNNGVREDPRHQLIIPTRQEHMISDVRGLPRLP